MPCDTEKNHRDQYQCSHCGRKSYRDHNGDRFPQPHQKPYDITWPGQISHMDVSLLELPREDEPLPFEDCDEEYNLQLVKGIMES